jgi:hypothetical protein
VCGGLIHETHLKHGHAKRVDITRETLTSETALMLRSMETYLLVRAEFRSDPGSSKLIPNLNRVRFIRRHDDTHGVPW